MFYKFFEIFSPPFLIRPEFVFYFRILHNLLEAVPNISLLLLLWVTDQTHRMLMGQEGQQEAPISSMDEPAGLCVARVPQIHTSLKY